MNIRRDVDVSCRGIRGSSAEHLIALNLIRTSFIVTSSSCNSLLVYDPHIPFIRMPVLMTKIEGKGNGIKTVVPNMSEVARALSRPPTCMVAFFRPLTFAYHHR